MKKSKKLHVEITALNWSNIKRTVSEYNENPERITPDIRADHIINEALVHYLELKGGK